MTNWVWSGSAFDSSGDASWSDLDNWQGDVVPTIAAGDTLTMTPTIFPNYGGGYTISKIASFSGTLSNEGTITLGTNSLSAYSNIYYDGFILNFTGNTTLTGGGTIVLNSTASAAAANEAATLTGIGGASPPTLENVDNTIEGSGNLGSNGGGNEIDIENDSGGVIDETGSATPLVIQTPKLVNSGLIEALGSAGIKIAGGAPVDQSGGGTLLADGGDINLGGYSTIIGGTLEGENGGEFIDVGGLDGTGALPVTIDAGTTVNSAAGSAFTFAAGANQTALIDNSGSIVLTGSGYTTFGSGAGSTVKLYGGGTVTDEDDEIGARFQGASTLENVDNTIIAGSANIGSGTAAPGVAFYVPLINDAKGVIEETGGNIISLGDGNTHEQITNSGLIEAMGAGGIILSATINQSGGGTLLADGGDFYVPQAGADIIGGAITSESGSAITLTAYNCALTLDGVSGGALTISKGSLVEATGANGNSEQSIVLAATKGQTAGLINQGSLLAAGGGTLYIGSGSAGGAAVVKLSGGGAVSLNNGWIDSGLQNGATTLENVDNAIEGAGVIHSALAPLTLVNDASGLIDADVTGATLKITTGQSFANNGVLEASGGTLRVDDAVTGAGSALVTANGTIFFDSSFNQNAAFDGAGSLVFAQTYSGTTLGFDADDLIDLTTLRYDSAASSLSVANGSTANTYVVDINEGGQSQSVTFAQSTPVRLSEFGLSADANGGTDITFKGPPTPGDFTGDGAADILFRNSSTGETYLWGMNGANVVSGAPTSTQVGSNWQIEGVGDFNGDGQTDLLWVYDNTSNAADPLNGVSYISLQNGPNATSGSGVVEQLSTNWQVAGIGDFTGDGVSDILYRYEDAANAADPLNGATYIDIMNGTQINWSASGFTSLHLTIPEWNVAAVADFDGSGQDAILWRYDDAANPTDPFNGLLYEWQMNGTTVTGQGLISQQPGSPNWQVEGTGDFNGDGHADILLRYENAANSADPLNGETEIDFMNGTTVTSVQLTSQQVDNSWQVAGIGDYNGDGKADILWQQTSSGATYIWEMNGANVIGGGMTSEQTGLGWTVQNGVHIQG